jgi:hypothetical protein
MINAVVSDTHESDTVLSETCPYLGGVATDLRAVVQAQCPGCRGEGACVVREGIRALADQPPATPPAGEPCAHWQTTDC